MSWWPFSRKPVTHKVVNEKFKLPKCKHDWIIERETAHTVSRNIDKFGVRYHLPITTPYQEILVKTNYFDFHYNFHLQKPDLVLRILDERFFDGICRKCDSVSLSYTKAKKEAEELAAQLIAESDDVKNRLDKYRKMLEKS